MTATEYERLGGVIGSLRQRANEEYDKLDPPRQATMRRVMLRMVAFEGGELTRRRVPGSELEYADKTENERVKQVLEQLDKARLIVGGSAENQWGEDEAYREPAHDKLINAWDRLLGWYGNAAETLVLQRRITQAAGDWNRADAKTRKGELWDDNPRLADAANLISNGRVSASETESTQAGFVRSGSSTGIAGFLRSLFPDLLLAPGRFILNALEGRFVVVSIRHRRDRRRLLSASITTIIIGLSALSGWALWERATAEHQKMLAFAGLDAAQVPAIAEQAPARALRLAVHAVESPMKQGVILPAAENALRDLLSTFGGVPLQDANGLEESDLKFSPDGRWLAASVSEWDQESEEIHSERLLLWDTSNPELPPRRLEHQRSMPRTYAFDPAGRWLATVSTNGLPQFWNLERIADSPIACTLQGHPGLVDALAFGPKGNWFATLNEDGIPWTWNLIDPSHGPTELSRIGDTEEDYAIAFDRTGKWLVAMKVAGGYPSHRLSDPEFAWDMNNPTAFRQVISSSFLRNSDVCLSSSEYWMARQNITAQSPRRFNVDPALFLGCRKSAFS